MTLLIYILLGCIWRSPVGSWALHWARASASPNAMHPRGPSATPADGADLLAEVCSCPPCRTLPYRPAVQRHSCRTDLPYRPDCTRPYTDRPYTDRLYPSVHRPYRPAVHCWDRSATAAVHCWDRSATAAVHLRTLLSIRVNRQILSIRA